MLEPEIIAGCRRQDRQAQQACYERFVDRIYNLSFGITGNADDAFDATQNAFLRAFQNFKSYDGRASLGTWIHRIAVNEALQLLRRRGVEHRHAPRMARGIEAPQGPEKEFDPAVLDAAIVRLSDEHRVLLLLRYQAELSYREIAAVLELPEGTIASRLNRARGELRVLLERAGEREDSRTTPHPRLQGPAKDVHDSGPGRR